MSGGEFDPTKVGNQPSLRTSSGAIWLVMGGILTAICAGMLAWLSVLNPAVAWTGFAIVLALYLAMIGVRLLVFRQRVRLITLAILFGLILLASLVCVIIINGEEWAAIA